MLRLLLFCSILAMPTLGEDPCKQMTVADCIISEENIVNRYNFDATICENLCKKSEHCQFWRVYQNDTMQLPECLHLSTNYHQDCITFAGPVDGDINSCLETDLSTCSGYIEEECHYVGDRLVDLEPPVGDITSIGECQEWGDVVSSLGANYFYFSGVTNECKMFSTLKWSCDAVRGPAIAPPLEECQEWILIQKRGQYGNPQDYFSSKLWDDYVSGFGDPQKEFWLGLDTISQLTETGNWELRVDLVDYEENNYTAFYSHFLVEEEPPYRLKISGFDSEISSVEDSLAHHNGMAFSTRDNDNDLHDTENCAEVYLGAWWYNHCHDSNLNGMNYNAGSLPETQEFWANGIIWENDLNIPDHDNYFSWPKATMKIRRKL